MVLDWNVDSVGEVVVEVFGDCDVLVDEWFVEFVNFDVVGVGVVWIVGILVVFGMDMIGYVC